MAVLLPIGPLMGSWVKSCPTKESSSLKNSQHWTPSKCQSCMQSHLMNWVFLIMDDLCGIPGGEGFMVYIKKHECQICHSLLIKFGFSLAVLFPGCLCSYCWSITRLLPACGRNERCNCSIVKHHCEGVLGAINVRFSELWYLLITTVDFMQLSKTQWILQKCTMPLFYFSSEYKGESEILEPALSLMAFKASTILTSVW